MTTPDLLQTFLQLHLASDNASVIQLPYILQNLSAEAFENSAHWSKWNARISSLIHSRESGARWAGLCLARQSCVLSNAFISQSSQGWVTVVLPMLSRNETLPVWKASARLILYVFLNAAAFPEFQRQVATPNVPKLTQALVQLCQKQTDRELHVLCTNGITALITSYPSLHRPMHPSLSTFVNACLDSVVTTLKPISTDLLDSMARMASVLPLSGGKTGAAGLWRKAVDEAISKCYAAFKELRSTYNTEGDMSVDPRDPLVVVPIHLEQLRCSAETLCALLCTAAPRPVPVPVAGIVELIVTLMKLTSESSKGNTQHYDPIRRTMETAAIPHILGISCKIATCLTTCAKQHLAPHITRLLTMIAFHLEQSNLSSSLLPLTNLTIALLINNYAPPDALLAGRILKALLPIVGILLAPADAQLSSTSGDSSIQLGSSSGVGKAANKNKRNQEPDDILGAGKRSIRISEDRKQLILSSLDAISLLLRTPGLPLYLLSLTSRLLLALSLKLPTVPLAPARASATTRYEILARVQRLCVEGAAFLESGRGTLSRTLPIIAWNVQSGVSATGLGGNSNDLLLDLMLHPRLPPLLREMPPMDVLTLDYSEEGVEERQAREALGVGLQARPDTINLNPNASQGMGIEGSTGTPTHSLSGTTAGQGVRLPAEVLQTARDNSNSQAAAAFPSEVAPQPPVTAPVTDTFKAQEPTKNTINVDKPGARSSAVPQSTPTTWTPVKQSDAPKSTPSTLAPAPLGSLSRTNDLMAVDDEDDDDIEVPPINMESDTDEE